MKTRINVEVDTDDLVENLNNEDALKLILAADLKIAEVNFTLEVIGELIKSLLSDLTPEEIRAELKTILKEIK